MERPVVVSAARTATGTFGGALREVDAQSLGSTVIEAVLARGKTDPADLDEVILGTIYQGGLGPNVARQAAVGAGVPYGVPAMTVNKLCGSGLKSIALAAQAIVTGEAEVVVAGGAENMSRVPYGLQGGRWGQRLGHGEVTDLMIMDGLWDCFYDCHMGITAENLADQYRISREDQDGFAIRSQENYHRAHAAGLFAEEIVPVMVPQRKGDPKVFDVDEHPRKDTSLERLGQLRPAFKDDGTVTAGNSSGINDGAAALLLMSDERAKRQGEDPVAFVSATAAAGVDPRIMGIGPAPAIRKLLAKTGLTLRQIDLLEVNEAFAAQSLAVGKELDWDGDRVNVNGGAIALGHAVGASGARIAVTLIHEMVRRGARRGIAALCIGGGMGIATLFEVPA